jgi:RNA polymerase sigma-70 factor, ECF subfamily
MHEGDELDEPAGPMADDQIRLIFTCCHPALAQNAQVALTLRLLGGLETAEIARAFLVPEPTMAQRLVRAQRKIKEAGIHYRIPDAAELPDRLRPVLAVIYLIFNEGHTASTGAELMRRNLCAEAVRLARVLSKLMPDEPEVLGLLALLLLTQSRQPARVEPKWLPDPLERSGSVAVGPIPDRRGPGDCSPVPPEEYTWALSDSGRHQCRPQ